VADGFRRAAQKAHNEAEFRSEAAKVIEAFADAAGLDLHLRQEYTLVNGRADAVYNRFVIEYENPGVLRDKNSYAANQHAIGQVKDYIQGIVRRQRHKEEPSGTRKSAWPGWPSTAATISSCDAARVSGT